MRAYAEFISKSFSKQLAYRSEVWLRILGNIVTIFVQVSIWKAVLGDRTFDGIELKDMITYTILATMITIIDMSNVYVSVDESIKTGNIATFLLKPLRYPAYLLANEIGSAAYRILFTLLPTLLIAWIGFGFQPPKQEYLIPFILSVFLAIAISFAMGYLISLLAFWFLTTFSLVWIYWGVTAVFSGTFLPFWFFSEEWARVANLLPFKFLGFVPAAIYMGKMPLSDAYLTIAMGVVWALVIYAFLNWLWWKSIRRLIIQGG